MKCAAYNPNISSCILQDTSENSFSMSYCAAMAKDMFYCPWRATATTAMVRSTMLVPTATIGAVRLAAPTRATSTSTAAMPT